jgi:PAS domain S-box-containing protein
MSNAYPESEHSGAVDQMGEAIDAAGWVERRQNLQIDEALDSLRNSEQCYRSVVEHLGEGMFVAQNNIIVFSNRQASEIMRIPNEELLRSDPVQWIHADDQAMVMDLRLKLRDKKQTLDQYEARHIGRDGVVRWLNIRPKSVAWSGGMATLTFFSEVTDRKAILEALQRSEERYRAVIEHSREGMFVVQHGKFVFANARAAELVRMEHADVLRDGYLHRIHPDDQIMLNDRRKRRTAGEDVPSRYEVRLLLPDQEIRWLDIGVTVVPWEGAPAFLTFFSDITERKLADEELQRTYSEREAILESALVGIVLSVDRRHQWVNAKFAEMVGLPREALIGEESLQIYPDRTTWEHHSEEQRSALIASGTYSQECQLKRSNGDLFWVQMAGQCVRKNTPDSGIIWTFLDITQRRQAEQDTRAALEQQRELNELRSRFVAMTSHEFRTPLATILSSTELLKYYGDRLPKAESLGILKSIEDSVSRMAAMVDRVLLLGKADARMLEFRPVRLDVIATCRSLVAQALAQHPHAACELVTQFDTQTLTGLFDEKLLRHIFENLLSNAIKYSPQGGQIIFRVGTVGGQVEFEVADRGIGIPQDELAHLFSSFHRASNVGTIQGTGLGLAIVKNSVDLHGGVIRVNSTLGEGTTFTVRI